MAEVKDLWRSALETTPCRVDGHPKLYTSPLKRNPQKKNRPRKRSVLDCYRWCGVVECIEEKKRAFWKQLPCHADQFWTREFFWVLKDSGSSLGQKVWDTQYFKKKSNQILIGLLKTDGWLLSTAVVNLNQLCDRTHRLCNSGVEMRCLIFLSPAQKPDNMRR